jgi:hypothetical protein
MKRYPGNNLSPLKYHKIIIGIISSYHKCSHHVPLVHRSFIVAVLELFALAFFSAASARGQ